MHNVRGGMYLTMIERRLWRTVKGVGTEDDLLNDLGFNLCVAPQSSVVVGHVFWNDGSRQDKNPKS